MRFLIVDDIQECRELLSAFLHTLFEKLEVVEADSGQAAISILAADPKFEMIVCDFTMPNGTGARVFRYLTEQALAIPFILFSALSDHDMTQFAGENFVGVVAKHDLARLEALVLQTADSYSLAPRS